MKNLKAITIALTMLGLAITVGCGSPVIHESPTASESPPGVSEAGEKWSRLQPIYWLADDRSKIMAPWHFWANPASEWLPDYAQAIYAPLRNMEAATPYAWRPFYDSQTHSPCLFYQTEDGEVRCLPGWVQMEPDDPRDGFYSEPTCSDIRRWVYMLPVEQTLGDLAQNYLVTARPAPRAMPRAYSQMPFTGRVWRKHGTSEGVRQCEEVTGDRFRFFERGAEMALADFVKLGSAAVDLGPR